jgi:hypothetical protein
MSPKTHMHSNSGPKVEWKTVAASNPDPSLFAEEVERALHSLTDNGFNVVSQLPRNGALIITGQRIVMAEGQTPAPTPDHSSTRRRILDAPVRAQCAEAYEVLYHYLEHGEQKQKRYATMVEALRVVMEHLKSQSDIVPINVIAFTTTVFEQEELPSLLKTFARDLIERPQ